MEISIPYTGRTFTVHNWSLSPETLPHNKLRIIVAHWNDGELGLDMWYAVTGSVINRFSYHQLFEDVLLSSCLW